MGVEILRDRWGIAHIYADTEEELFEAQGWNAARDRLFQFELWRMQAVGATAAVFGPGELERDRGARLHRYRGDLTDELRHYHPRGDAIIGAFVRGVNRWIYQTEEDPSLLPMEFALLGITPQRWTPEVVISRHQGLFGNLRTEVGMAKALGLIGVDRLHRILHFEGGDPQLVPDPAIDLDAIPDDVISRYTAFRDPLVIPPEAVLPEHRNPDRAAFEEFVRSVTVEDAFEPPKSVGSNNWVIAGSRTRSGVPILANDPHRAIAAPSLRYWVHLVAPGWNVIGAGEPTLPGVSIGHNDHGAWGLTTFGADHEDLMVYQTDPDDPLRYRYAGGWERMEVEHDRIQVRGEAEAEVEHRYTLHGPVLHEDPERHLAYAVRAAWLEPGGAPYLASLRMDQATTWDEFREACTWNHTPAENMIWADTGGTIGYQAASIRPLRRTWSGLLPVPGDGSYEWDGWLPITDLPSEVDPERGFVATANQFLFPPDYPHQAAMHYTWPTPYRAQRISEVLTASDAWDIAAVERLQNDDLTIPGRLLTPLLAGIRLDGAQDGSLEDARQLLLRWGHEMHMDSPAAGLYQIWERHLGDAFLRLVLPQPQERLIGLLLSLDRMVEQLREPDELFGSDPAAGRDALLSSCLEAAVAELTDRFGPDHRQWAWGRSGFHHVTVHHPLSGAVNEHTRSLLESGPRPRGGNGVTVSATESTDEQLIGGSFKIIVDLADWDASVGQNTPGQSGDPASPHYRDLFESWSRGEYFPVAFSRGAVEAVTEHREVPPWGAAVGH